MRRLLLPALLLAAVPVWAQPALDAGTITVSGQGLVSAPPDRAVVGLGVQTVAPTAAEALRRHEDDVARVLARVRSFGIADRQIQIEALQLGENYGPNGPDGYRAFRVVSVTTDSLAAVPEIVASVVESGANQLTGIDYTLRSAAPYRDRALDEAVAQARAKAERMAAAAGATLGSVVAMREEGIGFVQSFRGGPPAAPAVEAVSLDAEPGAYSAGSSQVQAGVVVQYRLVPQR